MAESDRKANSLVPLADDVARGRGICRALDVDSAIPAPGTSSAPSYNGKVQVDLLFLSDIIVLRVLDFFLLGRKRNSWS